jgi:probable F420-dependent oxidoreductase
MFATHDAMHPAALACAVEERGLESLFFPEHTHIPASRRTPFPGGGELPREYAHCLDLFVALSAAAAVTTRIRIATGICLVAQRDPIVLAKEVASLDVLSGGRVLLGIGAGWNVEEMANHGVAFEKRWAILREKVLAMKAIWSEDEASFDGEHVRFDRIWSWPKPLQPGGPPILLGADSKFSAARVADYCDGWMPIASGKLESGIAAMGEACATAGRDPATLQLTVFGVPPKPDTAKRLRDLGFTRLVFGLPPAAADRVLPLLDRVAGIARTLG